MGEIAVSVHQPNFMPWLKLLDKILASDVYVAFDTVQYTKSEYHGRQRIKTYNGDAWLSVPVLSAKGQRQLIEAVQIDNKQPWRRKHLKLLRTHYGKAAFFDEVFPLVDEVYGRDHRYLADLNVDLIEAFCRYLGSSVRILRARELPHDGDGTERLVDLVRGVGGDVHLTSTFGTDRRYIDWERVEDAGIAVRAQRFAHPVYEQLWDGFTPGLSALDMLCNCGRRTAEVLEAGRRFDTVDAREEVRSSARTGEVATPASRGSEAGGCSGSS